MMETYIDFKNIQIHYTDSGKIGTTGKNIVLLHGFLENLNIYSHLVEVLKSQYRVVTIDLLGHGKTGNVGYIHTMEEMASGVKAVLDNLNIRRTFMLGHSMGGYVTLAFAELFPDQMKGLILMNSSSLADSEEKKAGREKAIDAFKNDAENFISLSVPYMFSRASKKKLKTEIEQLKQEALQTSIQGAIAATRGMIVRMDREALLYLGPYPKMMIMGKKDPILKYETLLDQTNNDTELVEVENGHLSLYEDRDETVNAVVDFLKRHS